MDNNKKDVLIDNLTVNLPVLRTKLHMTQSDLADLLGISRQQVVAIENKTRRMTWSTFLATLLIFKNNEETKQLLSVFDIYTNELDEFITSKDDSISNIKNAER